MRTSGWVVDASVVAKWYLPGEESVEQADRLMDRYLDGLDYLTTPHLTRYELANAVHRAAREGRIADDAARRAVTGFDRLGLAQHLDDAEQLTTAVRLARRLGISFYDALYLALAEKLGLRMITADAALYHRVAAEVPYISLIQDLPE